VSAAPPLGLLSDVVPFSTVDGPGNRFVAFLQGCDFDCLACHNPHTIRVCTDCGVCLDACASGALSIEGGRVRWDAARCGGGDACVAACPNDSTPKARPFAVAEVVEMIRGPAPYLSGVTVSGGEATLQAPFVRALFAALQRDERLGRLSRFVDSHGAVPDSVWDELDPTMDAAMVDLKAFDDDVHRRLTGRPVDLVLRSIERLAARGKLHEVRLLMLPGQNDGTAALDRTGAWLRGVDPGMRVQVTGFRRHGVRPAARALPEPSPEQMAGYAEVLRGAGLREIVVV
jgi:YjjW family glycine radical enzyme activase